MKNILKSITVTHEDKYGLIWNCQLSELAKGVLSEVAMHYDIPFRQQAICSILCQCYINDVKPLDYKVLGNELKKVIASLDDFSPDMHEELVIGLEAFVDRSMIFFNHVRDLMPENDTQNLSALPELIGILKLIYSMKKFQQRRKKPNLKIDIQNACKKGTESWYYTQRELIVAKAKTLTKEFQLFRELVQKMYVDLKVSKLFYNKVFSRICDDYFTDCFLIIDKVISEDAKRLFARFDKSEFVTSEKIDQLVSDLYFTLKGLAIYRAHLSESAKSIPLQLDSIHLWSRCLLEVLIRNDFRDTKERITKAVQLEEVVDSNFKFSSSAVDTAGLFNKTCQLWKNIAWPEPDEAFAFVSKIVDNIANAGCFYGNLLDNRLKVAKFYDDVGSFDITEQLCITLNNLDHIRRNLQSLPKDLNFDQAIENLSHHGRDQQDRFRTVLTNILKGADDDLMNKTVIMIDQVGKKMEVDIYKHLQTFSSSPPTVNVNQAISPLLSYLQENSIKLQECLFKDVYHSFNIKIVDVTMKCLYQITLKVGEQKTSLFSFKSDTKSMTMMEVYNRLWDCQQVLKDFFFNGGDGIDLVTIENDHFYVQTVQFLNVAKLDTTRLIGLYFEEKLKAKQEENLGSLAVKLFYDISQHKLSVNGLSDPYVVIDLLPENLFSCSHKETKVCKKTLNPVFEETFTFIIDKALFQTSGTAVLFTVMDQDMISRNDYGGESVILMKDITIIDNRKDANQEEIPELNLKLSMPCISGEIFNLIDDRVDDDPNAKKFIAFRRKACDAAEDARNK
ncbi:uncharacterized protein TRIADDRAFT_60505 [Trichoplax adhaerens]|uniref:C2 domain-containing protein n=1 Tax=Trichoplax adhaerens TaxID=10228 RepID=B3S8D9_TRIAD|nr:hypothetical protein TRIADDRAFT_60505 [Trichoplax adhaerens]EDV20864.1 hypothetical protein TRIADDRAFT_60505 [Trichoplax adhaerens]|eukprot:XP_002116508.1 hypothetical protein TRIADDRAFT_60505 [Trichoplax adhaerens]